MADFIGRNAGSVVESDKTRAEFENERLSCDDLNDNSDTVGGVGHENSACFVNVDDDSLALQKVKLDVGESGANAAFTEGESAIVDNDGIEDKNEIVTNGAVENGKVHFENGSVAFRNSDLNLGEEEISGKEETFEEENGILDIGNNNKEVKDVHDAGNEVEESGIKTCEHQAVETEKEESDNSNGRSLQREEDGTHADVAEGAELEEHMNAKVELEGEQEEKAKSELACENGEVKLDDVGIDSVSVINDNSATGEGEPPKPVNEEPVKTRSWRDIAVDGMDSIPNKVQFISRTPMVRRSVPKIVNSAVSSVDLKSKIESRVWDTKKMNNVKSIESVSNINEESNIKDSISEEKLELVAEQKDYKLEFEAEKVPDNNVAADLFAKSKESDVGQKNVNTSTIAGNDKEEREKKNKRRKVKEEKARREEEIKRKEAEEEKLREEEAKKERLRKEEEAAELRKKLIAEEREKMRMAEERKRKEKAEKAQKRAEYKAQKEAEEKAKKKAKKQKKQSGTSDTSSVSSEVSATTPEKNPPDAYHDPETSRSAVSRKSTVLPSSKKKVSIPKDPLPLPLALRNRSKRKWMKRMWPLLLVVFAVLMLFIAGNYISSESLFQSFAS